MEPLSDVLRAVRLDGAFFYLAEGRPPWSVSVGAAVSLVPRVLPGVQNLVSYHILRSGECWAGLSETDQVRMEAGDVVVFPHGDRHFLSSEAGKRIDPGVRTAAPERHMETVLLGEDRGGPKAEFVCGFLGWDAQPFNPLLSALPRVLLSRNLATGWLAEFPKQVVDASRSPAAGSMTMLTRMAELLFVAAIQRYMEQHDAAQGWLAGLRDAVVGPALNLLHQRPTNPWTLADLAREIGTSRSVLAERFTALVGVPPMQYLTQWRMQLAAAELSGTSDKVATIAARVGYESEAAFSRVFKRTAGTSPASWRAARRR